LRMIGGDLGAVNDIARGTLLISRGA